MASQELPYLSEEPMVSMAIDKSLGGLKSGEGTKPKLDDLCEAIMTREIEEKSSSNRQQAASSHHHNHTPDTQWSRPFIPTSPVPSPVAISSQAPERSAKTGHEASTATSPLARGFLDSSMSPHSFRAPPGHDSSAGYHPWAGQFAFTHGTTGFGPHDPFNEEAREHNLRRGDTRNAMAGPMDCEVYDVDNDVVFTEPRVGHQESSVHADPVNRRVDRPSSGFHFPSVSTASTGFPHPHPHFYPQPFDPRAIPASAHPTHQFHASATPVHPPFVVQTAHGPALLLRPAGAPTPVAIANPSRIPPTAGFSSGPAHYGHLGPPPPPPNSRFVFCPPSSTSIPTKTTATTAAPASSDTHYGYLGPPSNSTDAFRSPSSTRIPTKTTVTTAAPASTDVSTRFQRWTEEEDQVLVHAAKQEGGQPPYNWNRIAAKYFPTSRTGPQCKARWKKALKPGLKRGKWEPEEDSLILELHDQGLKWVDIAQHIPGRVPDLIRQRFMNSLDPNKKKSPWTVDESKVLYEGQKQLGNKWSEISKLLPGRSENDVKNRWHNAKMAQRRKMRRLVKESARLTPFVDRVAIPSNDPSSLTEHDYVKAGIFFDESPSAATFMMAAETDVDDDSRSAMD